MTGTRQDLIPKKFLGFLSLLSLAGLAWLGSMAWRSIPPPLPELDVPITLVVLDEKEESLASKPAGFDLDVDSPDVFRVRVQYATPAWMDTTGRGDPPALDCAVHDANQLTLTQFYQRSLRKRYTVLVDGYEFPSSATILEELNGIPIEIRRGTTADVFEFVNRIFQVDLDPVDYAHHGAVNRAAERLDR